MIDLIKHLTNQLNIIYFSQTALTLSSSAILHKWTGIQLHKHCKLKFHKTDVLPLKQKKEEVVNSLDKLSVPFFFSLKYFRQQNQIIHKKGSTL